MQVLDTSTTTIPKLRRVLSLWDLVLYGIVAVTPSAPVTVFGLAQQKSFGHAVDTILIGMVAMVLTAVSYGRMAALYPSAGSAYTYVGRGLNPYLGFLTGWAMLLDYLFIPLFCTIYGTLAFKRILPQVPYVIYAAFFAGLMTYLNLRGIRATTRTSELLVAAMGLVLLTFIGLAIQYLLSRQGWRGLLSVRPFYAANTFEFSAVATATSFAALTYLGFDSVTTLAEDVKNPRRNVLLAAVLVCVFTWLFGGLLIYVAQLVWPDYQTFKDIETAFMDVTRRVGGVALFQAMAILLVVANIGAGLTSQVGAARLLFGMGRDNVFPRKIFAYLDPKRNTPTFNLWIIGVLAFGGSLVMDYELTGNLLNFGAFLGFMGVNLATIWQFCVVRPEETPPAPALHKTRFLPKAARWFRHGLIDGVVPGLGFLFCLGIWLGLDHRAKMVGGLWFAAGLAYLAGQTRGFRKHPVMIDFSEP
jgi:putrescine importer